MELGFEAEMVDSPRQKKVKKPNFVKRLIYKWALQAGKHQERENSDMNMKSMAISTSPRSIDSDKGIRFQVHKANGGFVIETAIYDRHKDRHLNSLHIITDDQDLGEQIGKIITMEALKQ